MLSIMWKEKIISYFRNTPLQVCIHEILLSFLILSLPYPLTAPKNIAWVLLGANAIFAIILQKTLRTFFWQTKSVFFIITAFLFLHFTGLIYTENTSAGWFLLGLLVPLWAIPLAILTFPCTRAVLRWYLRIFIANTFLYVILTYFWAFYRALRAWEMPDFSWSNFFYYENFANLHLSATYYGIMVCLVALLLITDLFFPKKLGLSPSRFLTIFLIVVFVLTLMLLATRMQLLILPLGILMLFLEYFRIKQKIWQGIGIGLGVLALFVLFALLNPYTQKRFQFIFDKNEILVLDKNKDVSTGRNWDGATLRFAQWQCASELIKRNWLLGVGTGDGQDELQKIYEEYKFYFASRYNRYNAHNQFLETWIALGVFGIISFLSIFIVPLASAWKNKNYLLLSVLTVFLLSAISESYLQRNFGVTILAIFYGLGLAWQKNQEAA